MTDHVVPLPVIDAVLSVAACSARSYAVTLTVRGAEDDGSVETTATGVLGPELVEVADDSTGAAAADYTDVLVRTAARADREKVGERLFAGLVADDLAPLWAKLDNFRRAGHQLRIRLDIGPPMLKALPWELLRDGDWIGLRRNLSMWRGSEPVPAQPAEAGPLRVLVVVCNPQVRQILADDELSRVAAAFADKLGRMHLEVLDGPQRPKLRNEIERLRPHVLHFIGHGMPRVPGRASALAFNWAPALDPSTGQLPAEWDLGSNEVNVLSDWTPSLVVVNACRTGDEPLDQVGGFAEAFLSAGARAVVSMQADVESPAAAQFATALYEGLADFAPLDRIIADSRRRLGMELGDTGEWAIPVLASSTDPADVLRITFDRPAESIEKLYLQPHYSQLRNFLDRSIERRSAWWAFDPPPSADVPGRSVLVIDGRSVSELEKTGKTWLTCWCLFTYFLRGYRVTYVDLAEPLRYRVPGKDELREVYTKDWLDLIRVIRNACLDDRQPEPLHPSAFAAFNATLNALVSGPMTTVAMDAPLPAVVHDEWQPFDDDRPRAPEFRQEILAKFRAALTNAPGGPHVIALDHAESILPEAFDRYVYPGLLGPIAATRKSPVRLVLVASADWLTGRLPADDPPPWARVSLGDFASDQFMRLARDYCRRHGRDFKRLEALFVALHNVNPGPVPVSTFDGLVRFTGREPVGSSP